MQMLVLMRESEEGRVWRRRLSRREEALQENIQCTGTVSLLPVEVRVLLRRQDTHIQCIYMYMEQAED